METTVRRLLSKTERYDLRDRVRAALGSRKYRDIAEEAGLTFAQVKQALNPNGSGTGPLIAIAEYYKIPITQS